MPVLLVLVSKAFTYFDKRVVDITVVEKCRSRHVDCIQLENILLYHYIRI